ncbi:MAG: arginine--tRNA ligase [Chloroflexi bacterium]|nr:arginine--tRNA ligase [Chloroflexota bacterium]
MLRKNLAACLEKAIIEAQHEGSLPFAALPDIVIEHPQNPEHGDFASGLSLKLSRAMEMSPLSIAERVAEHISPPPEVDKVVVAAPGFINFTLRGDWLAEQVETVLAFGHSYGDIDIGEGKRIQLEFVSVNPTGPLHVGHGRGAVLGSTLANVFSAAGFQVEREYYLNDMGSQIDAFKHSLYARYQQCLEMGADMPAEGYFGNYVIDLATEIIAEQGGREKAIGKIAEIVSEGKEPAQEIGKIGLGNIIGRIRQDLKLLNVDFDVWFSEKTLYQGEQYQRVMSLFQSKGYVAKKENAVWFESSALGDDKDNVLVRSDGSPTYFASDISYHYNKFLERKFDYVIDIWGADHQGHVPRMKAAIKALGLDPEQLKVVICQLVTLRRGEDVVKVSKRSGDIVTLREVIEEVGADACRFVFLSRSADSQMDFDLELAKKQSADNPVYYVQYAHARIASILRLAGERGIDYSQGDVALLTTEPELTLIRRLMLLSEVVEEVVSSLEPHHLAYYAQDLATVFHSFYKQCRVVSQDEALTKARLKLVRASQVVLARVLHLMGMTAPERM